MGTAKKWSRDWEHFDWGQIQKNLYEVEKKKREGKPTDQADVGISLEEFKEYFQWLYETQPEIYYKDILYVLLVQMGLSYEKAELCVSKPETLGKILEEICNKYT